MARIVLLSALGAFFVVSAQPAIAQTPRAERPYRGLFASGVGDLGQSLTATVSLSGGWDDNLLAAARGTDNAVSNPSRASGPAGTIGNLSASLNYSLQAGSVNVTAAASTAARYFPSLENRFIRASQGHLRISGSPRPRTSLSLGASVAYQPYMLLSLFPTTSETPLDGELGDLDASADAEPHLSYSGTAGVSQRLSRDTSVSANYTYRTSERPTGDGENYTYQRAGTQLSHQISSGLSLHAGYGYGEGRFVDGERKPHHSVDAGLNFNRALSLTRRTTVSFNTGSAATRSEEKFRFHILGGAQLVHEIGRTWAAWTAYGRRLQYHETWREPGLGNAMTFGIGGLLSRRLQFNSSGRVAIGTVGLQDDAPGFTSYFGSASLSYALARFANVGVSYGYYHHRFDEDAALVAGIPRRVDRQTVRATVSLWAPLVERARRN